METNTDKYLYLLEEIKSRIVNLEDALDNITHVRKSLKVSSIDVKAQIRDNISRHLEALRNREIWLLSQVELIMHGKEDVLSEKQGELLEVIGGMKKVCELLEQSTGTDHLELFEDQLSELIKSVETLNVVPEENPCINFSGENLELLESIRRFGIVDNSEDANITTLYKNMDVADCPGNKRKLITDAGPIENWLLNGKKYYESSSPVSVEKWLKTCKPFSYDDSEMGFSEISDLDNNWLLSLQKNPSQPKLAYFTEVKMSSPSSWIRESPQAPELPKTVISETYSKIAALGNENWLLYKQERSKAKSLPADLGNIHSIKDYSQWLRKASLPTNLPTTTTGQAYAALAASGLKQWLKPKALSKCNGKSDCSDCDRWLMKNSPSSKSIKIEDLESLADSDWLKVKDLDVISIENLDCMFSNCSIENSSCNQEDKSGIKKYNSMLQAQPNQNWLRHSAPPGNAMETAESTDTMSSFSEYLTSNDLNKWLTQPSEVPADVCKWLARSSVDRCKNCSKETCSKGLFSLFDEVQDMSTDTWLKN